MISFTPDKVILITGASSGIGNSCALLFNALGATVLAAGRNESRLSEARSRAHAPSRWHTVRKDLLEDMESLPSWISGLREKFGKLWGLVHAAGEGGLDSLRQYDLTRARHHFDSNVHMPLLLAKGFADKRNFVKGGAMLFMSSASALHPEKGHLLYGSGKAALATAMAAVSREVAPKGLRVHCLAPGLVDTPMLDSTVKILGEEYRRDQAAFYPFGLGKPDDIANMAAFLLSEKAGWITGQNYLMAGGRY